MWLVAILNIRQVFSSKWVVDHNLDFFYKLCYLMVSLGYNMVSVTRIEVEFLRTMPLSVYLFVCFSILNVITTTNCCLFIFSYPLTESSSVRGRAMLENKHRSPQTPVSQRLIIIKTLEPTNRKTKLNNNRKNACLFRVEKKYLRLKGFRFHSENEHKTY